MKRLLYDYSLGIFLCLSWLGSWLAQWLTHSGTFTEFLNATFENWQSEYQQLFLFVVLSTYLYYKNSPQSKDGSERVEQRLKNIEDELKRLK